MIPSSLWLQSLALHYFRNYTQLTLTLDPQPVVLTGHNGAGKTNILEAISMLAPGRGLRRAKLAEIDNTHGQMYWALHAHLCVDDTEFTLGTGRDATSENGRERRIIKLDGEAIKNQTLLAGKVAMLWLTPQMNHLFTEGGGARRRFMDRLIYNFDPEHVSRDNAYTTVMRERNRLLQMKQPDPYWLTSLEEKMAEKSVAIAAARLQTLVQLTQMLHEMKGPFPIPSMHFSGLAEDALSEGKSAMEAEQLMVEVLAQSRSADAVSGRSTAGAHKSELEVIYAEKQMEAAYCSSGEQKALLLSIILAQAHALARWYGRVPLLLLDEVAAHLDESRRAALFEHIQALRAQAWLTGTDGALFNALEGQAQFFNVENSSLKALTGCLQETE